MRSRFAPLSCGQSAQPSVPVDTCKQRRQTAHETAEQPFVDGIGGCQTRPEASLVAVVGRARFIWAPQSSSGAGGGSSAKLGSGAMARVKPKPNKSPAKGDKTVPARQQAGKKAAKKSKKKQVQEGPKRCASCHRHNSAVGGHGTICGLIRIYRIQDATSTMHGSLRIRSHHRTCSHTALASESCAVYTQASEYAS